MWFQSSCRYGENHSMSLRFHVDLWLFLAWIWAEQVFSRLSWRSIGLQTLEIDEKKRNICRCTSVSKLGMFNFIWIKEQVRQLVEFQKLYEIVRKSFGKYCTWKWWLWFSGNPVTANRKKILKNKDLGFVNMLTNKMSWKSILSLQ